MLINGKLLAAEIISSLRRDLNRLKKRRVKLQLGVVLVGKNPDSLSFIKQKQKSCRKIGAKIILHQFTRIPSYQELAQFVQNLAADPKIQGVIVQRPLPPSLPPSVMLKQIPALKDVDGFQIKSPFESPIGLAIFKILSEIYYRLIIKKPKPRSDFPPRLLKWLKTQKIVLVGHGDTAGKPIADLMSSRHLDIIILTSRSENISEYLLQADIIISCAGKPGIIKAEQIKSGVILIGVGLQQIYNKLKGDYVTNEIANTAGFYTPVPGGVGPVNVACLMQNLVRAAILQS